MPSIHHVQRKGVIEGVVRDFGRSSPVTAAVSATDYIPTAVKAIKIPVCHSNVLLVLCIIG